MNSTPARSKVCFISFKFAAVALAKPSGVSTRYTVLMLTEASLASSDIFQPSAARAILICAHTNIDTTNLMNYFSSYEP